MFSSKSTLLINSICRARGCKGFANQAVKWDIVAAVCVERLPLVTPSINKHQKEFRDHLSIIELEKSCKSDHEIRHEADLAYLEKLKKSSVDQDLDGISNITAQDFEDASTDELSKFKPAPIQTEADKSNDQKSLERSLQSHLILLVEQQLGNKSVYILPQGKHNDGETLRQTAERVLKENCGDEIGAQFFGNAPTGYYKYKYPEEKNGATGAKIFFYYARHRSGQVKTDTPYKWLNRKELVTMLPSTYHSSLNSFLVEERE